MDKVTRAFDDVCILKINTVWSSSHAWLATLEPKNARVIDRGNSRVRNTLESWHSAITSQVDNNSKQLPRQYSILL